MATFIKLRLWDAISDVAHINPDFVSVVRPAVESFDYFKHNIAAGQTPPAAVIIGDQFVFKTIETPEQILQMIADVT